MFRRERDADRQDVRRNPDRPLKNLLVTGGCGFIGCNFVNYYVANHPHVRVINLDKMDYCANEKSIQVKDSPNYVFVRGDICNTDLVMHIYQEFDIDTVVNFAAQSHVDNSFANSLSFTKNNVFGTHNLLECARVYNKIEKFIHVSTDEVYGEVTSTQQESAMLNPTNPYAATKAAAEFIVKSYHISFGLPCIITRGNNVYGRYQYPEKVIPRFIMLLAAGEKLTIQGNGLQKRTFIHASDVATGFATIVDRGIIGEVYNIGSREEHSVIDLAHETIRMMKPNDDPKMWITTVPDRDFNDQRYDITSDKLMALGWQPKVDWAHGFKDTVEWYSNEALPNGFWSSIKKTISGSAVAHPKTGDTF